jgi:nicotinamide riboside transporter PnuC
MIGWLGFALSLTGVYLNANKNSWCWVVWIISNILWIIYAFTTQPIAIPLITAQSVYLVSNFYGIKKWRKI